MNRVTLSIIKLVLLAILLNPACDVSAQQSFSPSDVFSGVEQSNRILTSLIRARGLEAPQRPPAYEINVRPMHVYELHITAIDFLYHLSLSNDVRPPPIIVATPISYTPTDVFYLTGILLDGITRLHEQKVQTALPAPASFAGKKPSDVYAELNYLILGLNLLRGNTNISPNEVYAQITRAKEDVQAILIALARRLADSEARQKALLMTATFGIHPDGSIMPDVSAGKKPSDVLQEMLRLRGVINRLRAKYELPVIVAPEFSDYGTINPQDVFLQTQFVIAEINLLKQPLSIKLGTPLTKTYTNKTPTDVFQQAASLVYMLNRLLEV